MNVRVGGLTKNLRGRRGSHRFTSGLLPIRSSQGPWGGTRPWAEPLSSVPIADPISRAATGVFATLLNSNRASASDDVSIWLLTLSTSKIHDPASFFGTR